MAGSVAQALSSLEVSGLGLSTGLERVQGVPSDPLGQSALKPGSLPRFSKCY